LKAVIRSKVEHALLTHKDLLVQEPEKRAYIVNSKPGPYGGFSTMMMHLLLQYNGEMRVLDTK
jgi:hypothetical protein